MFPKYSKRSSSNSKGNFEGLISSSGACGSKEGSRAESRVVGGKGSDSATRISSWLYVRSSREGLDLDMKELFSVIRSKISMPSIGVLCEKDPLVVALRQGVVSMSSPE